MAGARHIVQRQPIQTIYRSRRPPRPPQPVDPVPPSPVEPAMPIPSAGARRLQSRAMAAGVPPALIPGLAVQAAPTPGQALLDVEAEQRRRREAARAFDDMPDMYAMEFMRFGDVHSLLVKGAAQGAAWRSEELWMVFECRRFCSFFCSARSTSQS